MQIIRESVIRCPYCGHESLEVMPEDACVVFYRCRGCGEMLTPESGDCCVFCSYGTVPCPAVQRAHNHSCGCGGGCGCSE